MSPLIINLEVGKINSKYTESFKLQAVEKALNCADSISQNKVATELGVGKSTLSSWIAKSRHNKLESNSHNKRSSDDRKNKEKQFVKIYGQMASIMPYEIAAWEKLFWFLKFLIPKLIVRDPDADQIDELLNSVDLSSYGLERVKLNHSIGLDGSETEVDPQNPNPRGTHDSEEEHDPLDDIIRSFNERWFQGWSATPEEQRVKFVNIADNIKAHPDYDEKYKNNRDVHNRELAFEKIFEDVMLKNRRSEMELYKLLASDTAFKAAMQQSLQRFVGG